MRRKFLHISLVTFLFSIFIVPVIFAAQIEDISGETKEERVERLFYYIYQWSREYEELEGPAIEELRSMGVESIEILLPHLESKDIRQRVMMENLINGVGADCTHVLVEGLSFDEAHGRQRSAIYLGNVGDECAVSPLIDLLEREDDWYVLSGALTGLGNLAARDIDVPAHPLVPFATHDSEPVRRAAVVALGRIGNEDTIPVLLHAFNDELYSVRYPAAEAVASFGDAAVALLVDVLTNGPFVEKALACYALGLTGSDAAYEHLESALTFSNATVRAYAVEGFRNLGDDRIRITLIRMKHHESDPAVLGAIEEALEVL